MKQASHVHGKKLNPAIQIDKQAHADKLPPEIHCQSFVNLHGTADYSGGYFRMRVVVINHEKKNSLNIRMMQLSEL
jgi:hypothetical protein